MQRILLLFVAFWLSGSAALAQAPLPDEGPDRLVRAIEAALAASDAEAYGQLFSAGTDPHTELRTFTVPAGVTRALVRERDRVPLAGIPAGTGFRLVLEAFVEQDRQAAIYTFRVDIRRAALPPDAEDRMSGWRIHDQELLTAIEGLFRLTLDPDQQFAVRGVTITAEDFVLTFPSGTAFVSETSSGVTGVLVMGPGEMRFSPQPAAERGQVRIFCGEDVLVAKTSAAFVRINPSEFAARVSRGGLVAEPVNPRDFARAQAIFSEEVGKSFTLDLHEVSPHDWSLVPGYGDFLAEVRTRRYGTLTYARSAGEPEDITLFDRARRRNISVYASQRIREARGVSYDEDDLADYDILDYDIEASFSPGREWLEGYARIKLRVRNHSLATLTLKLHEALVVRSAVSEQQGRLLAIRVRGQNSLILNLPRLVNRDDVLVLRVSYAGRIPPQPPDREVLTLQPPPTFYGDAPIVIPEPRFVFSNRSYWYPQGVVTDFATARLRLAVPTPYVSVASGSPAAQNPQVIRAAGPGEVDRVVSEFVAGQPLRYLAWLISEMVPAAERLVAMPAPAITTDPDGGGANGDPQAAATGVTYNSLDLSVVANRRQVGRGRAIADDVVNILEFYASRMGDLPYPSLTLALVDNELPGGHSPAYFALLYQPLPTSTYGWRNDPVHFDSFPQFFLAHELAHQYWGQAIGWKSYHEQWISEGFAQYFAALFAEHREAGVFRDILRRMRRSVLANEREGPIALGYRLGHIKGDSRVFRAIIYNKGALVLHMLRRLAGDEMFFAALRQLYHSSRFTKIGTEDVQRVFEEVTGLELGPYFQRWVYGSALPRIAWSWRRVGGAGSEARPPATTAAQEAAPPGGWVDVRFDQGAADPAFLLPVTLTLAYADRSTEDVIVPLTEASVEIRVPLRSRLRSVTVNDDHAALAHFTRVRR